PRDRDGHAARLERAGRVEPLLLDQQPREPERLAEARRRQERREALPERGDVGRVADRQPLVGAPERRPPPDPRGPVERAAGRGEVVAGEEHLAAGRTDRLRRVDRVRPAAVRALEPAQEAVQTGTPARSHRWYVIYTPIHARRARNAAAQRP